MNILLSRANVAGIWKTVEYEDQCILENGKVVETGRDLLNDSLK